MLQRRKKKSPRKDQPPLLHSSEKRKKLCVINHEEKRKGDNCNREKLKEYKERIASVIGNKFLIDKPVCGGVAKRYCLRACKKSTAFKYFNEVGIGLRHYHLSYLLSILRT